jgi:hypothetical protein
MDWYSWFSGMIGGGTGILISHPIDTIKTYHQLHKTKNITQALKNIIQVSGVKSLYRGLIPPLIGMMMEKAIVFGVQKNTQSLFTFSNNYINIFMSGTTAGIVCASVVVPIEKFKIKMQNGENFKSISKEIFSKNYLSTIRNLYYGLPSTLMREGPGFGVYFLVYHMLKNNTPSFTSYHSVLYGSISGSIAWISMYPSDPIKTIQQSNNINFTKAIKLIYSNFGIYGFYRGLSLALLRAIPLHAGVFGGISLCDYIFNKKITI